jgi:nitroreductase
MSELLHEINIRRASRAMSEKSVPADVVARFLTAATYAPSCFNWQSWRFMVINEKDQLQKIQRALTDANYWVKKAPVIVAVATKLDLDCQLSDRRDYALFDCGLAVQNLILQAYKDDLYAHPLAGFDPLVVKEEFGIPEEYIIITLVAVGYPGDDSHLNEKHGKLEHSPRNRKPEEEVIAYNQWSF